MQSRLGRCRRLELYCDACPDSVQERKLDPHAPLEACPTPSGNIGNKNRIGGLLACEQFLPNEPPPSLLKALHICACWESSSPAVREPGFIRLPGNGPNRPSLSAANTASSISC